jgi:predicted DNA binding CopG/RHH family protein
MRPVQYFSGEQLASGKAMSSDEILDFLEGFRRLTEHRPASRLISMKIPEDLLQAFRTRCRLDGVPYQRQIKRLMREWLSGVVDP